MTESVQNSDRPITSFEGKLKYTLTGDSNDLLLFKIQKLAYLRELQKGKIYMKNIKYHRNNDTGCSNSAVGDNREGVVKLDANNCPANFTINGKSYGKPSSLSISISEENTIFCTMAVEFEYVNDHQFHFKQGEQIISDFVIGNSNEYGAIILDKKRFIERCNNKLKELNLPNRWDHVKYSDDEVGPDKLLRDNLSVIFHKRMSYSHQKEFRLWVNTKVDDYFEFDIGDISDISVIIDIDSAKNGIILTGDFVRVEN